MTGEEAARVLSMHLMQCGMLMPIDWVQKNGEGSQLHQAMRMALDALCPGIEISKNGLAPCPFCGGEAEMKVEKHIPEGYDYTPRCKETRCCGRLTKKYTNKDEAIRRWNGWTDIILKFGPDTLSGGNTE